VDRFDRADIYDFQKDTSVTDTLDTIAIIQANAQRSNSPELGFFIACNHAEAIQSMKQACAERSTNKQHIVTYESNDEISDRSNSCSMKQSVIEFILLSRCRFIVGTYRSSFSDEAAIFSRLSMKICANKIPSSEPYHSYGQVMCMGRNIVCPDSNLICSFLA
jgi:hypothetical protein